MVSRRLSILAVLSLCAAHYVAYAADEPEVAGAPDPRVQITSPISGATFAPGDRVTVDISVDESIQVLRVMAGMYPAVLNFADSPPFRIPLVVPRKFAGETQISVLVLDIADNEIVSAPIPIIVRPATPPSRLLATEMLILDEGTARGIVVHGVFADGLEIALSPSVVGTTYMSADSWIASVDTEGNVSGVSKGTTSITTQNGGISAFTVVHVKGEYPAPPRDVTGQVRIEQSEVRIKERKYRYQQTLTISNTNAEPIPGPLVLTLHSLPVDVRWVNHGGVTENVPPGGTDYTSLDLASGVALAPGESVSLELEFDAVDQTAITFTPRISQAQRP